MKLLDPTTHAAFGNTPLNDPDVTSEPGAAYYKTTGVVSPIPSSSLTVPKDAISNSIQFRCIWGCPEPDVTNL